jgi:hypothetical protein
MDEHPHFKNPPIKEAIFDIQLSPTGISAGKLDLPEISDKGSAR